MSAFVPYALVISLLLALPACWASASAPAPAPRPAVLDATEQSIVAAVQQGNDNALALLEKVVNINSGTMYFAGVRAVGAVFQRFERLDEVASLRTLPQQTALAALLPYRLSQAEE